MMVPGDRRRGSRMAAVGPLWGTLHLAVAVEIVNVSPFGVLVSSPISLPRDSIQHLRIVAGDHEVQIDARVCHARPHEHQGEPGELIGLEFLTTSVPSFDTSKM